MRSHILSALLEWISLMFSWFQYSRPLQGAGSGYQQYFVPDQDPAGNLRIIVPYLEKIMEIVMQIQILIAIVVILVGNHTFLQFL